MLLLLLVVGVVVVVVARWEDTYSAAIFPGVKVGGIDLGGTSLAEARTDLAPLQEAALYRKITVVAGNARWQVTPAALGLRLNIDQRLQEAYALGRESNALDRFSTQVDLALQGRNLSLVGNYDSEALGAFIRQADKYSFQPARAAVVRLASGQATISVQAQTGTELDEQAATTELAAALADPSQTVIRLPVEAVAPPVSEAEAQREVKALHTLLAKQLHLQFGSRQWTMGARVIAPVIALTTVVAPGGTATYRHSVDLDAVRAYVNGLARQIDRPVRSATIAMHGAVLQVVAAQSGYVLDRYSATQSIGQAMVASGSQDVALPVSVVAPMLPTAAAERTAQQVAIMIRRPLALTFEGRTWLLTPAQLGTLLDFTSRQDPVSGPWLDFHVDPRRLAHTLATMAQAIAVAPVDARFEVAGTQVRIVPSLPGRRVDFVALALAIEQKGRATSLPVPTQAYEGSFTTAQAEAMHVHDLLIAHATYFPGSSVNRLTNIAAAARHLDYQLIAPGDVFSFDSRIGDISPQGGYVQGIDIIDNQDVPGIGGGVCQVAVTLFQSALYTGMEIIERVPHANVVSYYNPVGMDATVYVAPGGPDVKFLNNTGNWVLIHFVPDLANYRLTAEFFGTNPHFSVTVHGPYSTQEPNGDVDAWFDRTVKDRTGRILLQARFTSHYVPTGSSQ
jgi:vancomycin resistance protein YoaR